MAVRGIRGATSVAVDTREAVLEATRELLLEILRVNQIEQFDEIASILLTTTPDLTATFPAEFARNPLGEFAKVLKDTGVPFDEPAGKESDENIPWSREQALVGTDRTSPNESADHSSAKP